MGTSSSTQRGSLDLPQDTRLSILLIVKLRPTYLAEAERRVRTPVYGSWCGVQIPGTQLSPRARLRAYSTGIWVNGQFRMVLEIPTRPTETTSSGKSDS